METGADADLEAQPGSQGQGPETVEEGGVRTVDASVTEEPSQAPAAVVPATTIVNDTRQPMLPPVLQEPPTLLPVEASIVSADTLDPAEAERLLNVVKTLRQRPIGFYHRFPVPFNVYKTYCQLVSPSCNRSCHSRLFNHLALSLVWSTIL